jgi:hypothetical protein
MTMPSLLHLSRALVAVTCSLVLTLPTAARASEPKDDDGGGSGETSEVLSERASEHVTKAIRMFNNADYVNAEAEFKRAAFFAPKWRPLHFNIAVVAEAQGKLGVAINEYKQFKQHATSEEELIVDQRIFELDDRRKKIAAGYKRQIATGAAAMTIGVGGVGVGVLFIVLYAQNNKKIAEMEDTTYDMSSEVDSSLTGKKTTYLYGAALGLTFGLAIVAYSAIPLSKAIKSKRMLDGIALGPTRLKWNGGLGATLKF